MTKYLGDTTIYIYRTRRDDGRPWYSVTLKNKDGIPLAALYTGHTPKVEEYEAFITVDLMVEAYISLYADDVVWVDGDRAEEDGEDGEEEP